MYWFFIINVIYIHCFVGTSLYKYIVGGWKYYFNYLRFTIYFQAYIYIITHTYIYIYIYLNIFIRIYIYVLQSISYILSELSNHEETILQPWYLQSGTPSFSTHRVGLLIDGHRHASAVVRRVYGQATDRNTTDTACRTRGECPLTGLRSMRTRKRYVNGQLRP